MTSAEGIEEFVVTPHAAGQILRRGLTKDDVARVVRQPEQRLSVRSGRDVLQSRFELGDTGSYLVRVVVDVERTPAMVVTAYRTSKVEKYWRREK